MTVVSQGNTGVGKLPLKEGFSSPSFLLLSSFFTFFSVFLVLQFGLEALFLLGRSLSHASSSGYSGDRVSLFALGGLDQDLPIDASCNP
jgi:hypothetical protein